MGGQLTPNLGLVLPVDGTSEVTGNNAQGIPNEAANLLAIDEAYADLAAKDALNDYAASGAITQTEGTVTLSKAGVAAMTIADPLTPDNDGNILRIISKTAFAHTVVFVTGLNGGANHKATFGGAAGDQLVLEAIGGKWFQCPSINQTLSAS